MMFDGSLNDSGRGSPPKDYTIIGRILSAEDGTFYLIRSPLHTSFLVLGEEYRTAAPIVTVSKNENIDVAPPVVRAELSNAIQGRSKAIAILSNEGMVVIRKSNKEFDEDRYQIIDDKLGLDNELQILPVVDYMPIDERQVSDVVSDAETIMFSRLFREMRNFRAEVDHLEFYIDDVLRRTRDEIIRDQAFVKRSVRVSPELVNAKIRLYKARIVMSHLVKARKSILDAIHLFQTLQNV